MASGSSKKLAAANSKTLNQLHLITAIINIVSILGIFVLKRPASYKPWLILSIPSFIIEYNLEKSGRPTFSGSKLIRSGDDIHQQGGLYEYFFDIVYLTWAFDILMVIIGSNKVWWLYSVIPGFAIYKLYGIVSPFLQNRKGAKAGSEEQQQQQQQSASGTSKRQQKLQARREKGNTVKYR